MPRDTEKFTQQWLDRIDAGQKQKEDGWEKEYEVGRCKDYWRGHQLDDPLDEYDQRRVQINKVHPTVKASIPTLYFHDPYVRIRPTPSLSDTPGQVDGLSIDDRAQLLQDWGNTLVRDSSVNFDEATHYAMKEAHWAIGCCRVMYEATPVENPAADAPPLKEDEKTEVPTEKREGDILGLSPMIPSTLLKNERLYVKRIPARQLLCSADHTGTIEENAWLGYWSVYYLEDVKQAGKRGFYNNTEELKASSTRLREDGAQDKDHPNKTSGDKIRLYHIWAQREKVYYVFAEGYKKPLKEEKYKRLPLKYLRFDVDPDSFWPIPPIYHELHPQDEVNDSREWLRLNRKGTVPRFTYDREAVEPKDMRKLETGEMGTYIPRRPGSHQPIEPVQQPNYSVVAAQTYSMARAEFDELSMVASESRGGVPLSKTATQANIANVRSQVQESFDRIIVAKWLASIVEEAILLSVEKMPPAMWVLKNADQSAAGFPLEAQRINDMWQIITKEQAQDATYNCHWEVTIEPASMSPVAEQEERERWLQTSSLLANPIMTRMMAFSPLYRKRTLTLEGIKSARDQELFGQLFQQMIEFEMRMAQMGQPPAKGVASQPGGPTGMGSPNASPSPQAPPQNPMAPGGPRPTDVSRPMNRPMPS